MSVEDLATKKSKEYSKALKNSNNKERIMAMTEEIDS